MLKLKTRLHVYQIFALYTIFSAVASSLSLTMPPERKILCVGLACLDTIATIDEFPAPDSKVRSKSLHNYGGGNAANTAVAISRLGKLKVDLLSAVGNDSNGDTILKELEMENVGVNHVQRYDGDSAWSYILVANDTRTIIHQPASCEMSIDHVKAGINLEEYCAVHFDCRHPEAAVYLAQQCVDMGIPYSVDVERPRDGLLDLMKGASIIISNADYSSLALGLPPDTKDEREIICRFEKVLKKQAPNAAFGIMTRGAAGSYLIRSRTSSDDQSNLHNDDGIILLSKESNGSPRVEKRCSALWCDVFSDCDVVDTTGAGDAFQGGFLSALWSMLKPSPSFAQIHNNVIMAHVLRMAARVAARKNEKVGAREGLPSQEDDIIEEECRRLQALLK